MLRQNARPSYPNMYMFRSNVKYVGRKCMGIEYRNMSDAVNTASDTPQASGWRNHSPCSGIAADLLEVVQNVETHGTEAIEVAIAIHLFFISTEALERCNNKALT